jgi:hypothetical protein
MKKYILTTILFVSYFFAFGQIIKEQIRTDPNNPFNPDGDEYLNTFDWTTTTFNTIVPWTQDPITSPFFQFDNEQMEAVIDANDFHVKDGWELIKTNLDITTQVQEPYLILYNRYTSILRVLTAMNADGNYSYAKISVRHSSNSDDATNNMTKIGVPLDNFRTGNTLDVVSPFNNSEGRWFYADFIMNYDPCVCYLNSKLIVKIELVNESKIYMTGSINGTITNITDKSGSSTKRSKLSFSDLGPIAEKGSKVYNGINSFRKDIISDEILNSSERANFISFLEVKGALKEGESERYEFIDNQIIDNWVEEFTINYQMPPKVEEKIGLMEQFKGAVEKSDFLKGTLKAIPYIGTAFSVVDAFIGGGKKSSAPQKVQIMPMSINATAEFNGNIKTNHQYGGDYIFYTPGTELEYIPSRDVYPRYNHPLGIFNLKETPVIEFGGYVACREDYYYPGYFDCEVEYKAKAKGDIKYVLNPYAGFKNNPEIMFQIIFKSPYALDKDNFYEETGKRTYCTKLLPLSSYNDLVIEYFEQFGGNEINQSGHDLFLGFSASIKVFVNLERVDADANTQNVLFVATYPINIVKNTNGEWASWGSNFQNIETDINYSNMTFNSAYPFQVSAWNNINLTNIKISSTEQVNIFAGNSIKISPNSSITGPCIIRAGSPNGKVSFIPPVTVGQSDCPESKFKVASVVEQLKSKEIEVKINVTEEAIMNTAPNISKEVEKGEEIRQEKLDEFDKNISIFPNPSSSVLNIRIGSNSQVHSMEIYNSKGVVVKRT